MLATLETPPEDNTKIMLEPLPNLEKLKENVSEQPATITTENKCRIKRDKGKQEGEKNILEDSTI